MLVRNPYPPALLSSALALALLCCAACEPSKPSEQRAQPKPPAPLQEAVPLEGDFLRRAHRVLLERVGSQARLLEMRARGHELSFTMLHEGKLCQLDYVETALSGSSAKRSASEPKRVPLVRIFGPDPVEVQGEGPLDANLFAIHEVNVTGIISAFAVALQAVDPENGQVSEVVVRRFLPFSNGIRARIFVRSPKMGGSIDTNENGIPLRSP